MSVIPPTPHLRMPTEKAASDEGCKAESSPLWFCGCQLSARSRTPMSSTLPAAGRFFGMKPPKPLRLAPAALVFLLSLVATRQSGAQALERLFYYVDRQDSYESLVKNIDQITILGPQ